MAKLYFKYGAMNSGKSTALLQTAHNYEENKKRVLVLKPVTDTKGHNQIISRIGIKRKADYLIKPTDSIYDVIHQDLSFIDGLLVDEAQFLSPRQVEELFTITKIQNVPVICYGLRTDFRANGFAGSDRLLELADDLEELTTICKCGKKARFNVRVNADTGEIITDGDQVAIDGANHTTYIPYCGECYLKEVRTLVKQVVKKRKNG